MIENFLQRTPVNAPFYKWVAPVPCVGIVIHVWKRTLLQREMGGSPNLPTQSQIFSLAEVSLTYGIWGDVALSVGVVAIGLFFPQLGLATVCLAPAFLLTRIGLLLIDGYTGLKLCSDPETIAEVQGLVDDLSVRVDNLIAQLDQLQETDLVFRTDPDDSVL